MATSRLVAGVHRPCRECTGTDRAGTVHQVFIVQGPCRDRAGTVHGVFFCCCMDRAGTVHRLSGAKRPTSPTNSLESILYHFSDFWHFLAFKKRNTKILLLILYSSVQ